MVRLAVVLPLCCCAQSLVSDRWDDAYVRANQLLKRMSREQKQLLMKGKGWAAGGTGPLDGDYVGTTPDLPAVSVPSINAQDAAGGYRTSFDYLTGTVTCWPSLLSMAATFDVDMTYNFASALGQEFRSKGANMILGPSINVHRVARNGRNFEYLSGEDPYLGSQLTAAYVKGVQDQGLMSTLKHFVYNSQETNRNDFSADVSDKTAWELYYPPFQAGVDAGATAAMCSYNLADGEHVCGNEKQLQNLKRGMGFRGFVQSDWWATHNTSVKEGLDQEMPGSDQATGSTDTYFSQGNLSTFPESAIDESASRILASMYYVGAIEHTPCTPPHCDAHMHANVTTDDHAQMARWAATNSVVLLKNDANVLPLSREFVTKIAVIGSASVGEIYDTNKPGASWFVGDYYSGGGSGHVVAPYVVNTHQGISDRAAREGIEVVHSPTDDVLEAAAAAEAVDVAIVVAGTSSGESLDRENLSLDNNADRLISAVAGTGKPTIVLTMVPGAIVMPWKDDVAAILTLFLGGQETGSAWASVLFGDHAPTGRLPVMMPMTEADTIPPADSPTLPYRVPYSEGLATSYRNPNFKAAFPFGHGLTYSEFKFGTPKAAPCKRDHTSFCVSVRVKNVGERRAVAKPQLYLEFPDDAGMPRSVLKGFGKTDELNPGESGKVVFELTPKDMSYYDDGQGLVDGKWVQADSLMAYIGVSSEDMRGSVHLAPVEARVMV